MTRAVDRDINALKQLGVKGEALFSELVTVYNLPFGASPLDH